MSADLLDLAGELSARGEPYALATVVWRRSPSSGQVGSKALITADAPPHGDAHVHHASACLPVARRPNRQAGIVRAADHVVGQFALSLTDAFHADLGDHVQPALRDGEHGSRRSPVFHAPRPGMVVEMTVVEGIKTNIPMHLRILGEAEFIAGKLNTAFMERFAPRPGGRLAEAV